MENNQTFKNKATQKLTQKLNDLFRGFLPTLSESKMLSILFMVLVLLLMSSIPIIYEITSIAFYHIAKISSSLSITVSILTVGALVLAALCLVFSIVIFKARKTKKKISSEAKFLLQVINMIPMNMALSSDRESIKPYSVDRRLTNSKQSIKQLSLILQYIHSDMDVDLVAYYKKALDTNTEQAVVIKSPTVTAIRLNHLIRFSPINIQSERHILITLIDISMSYKATRKAEINNKNMSEFLSNLSHEVRTPLNSIIGFTSLLPETEDEETKQEYLKIINKKSAELNLLMNKILFLSKLESGKYTPANNIVDLNEVFFSTVNKTIDELKFKEVKHYNEKFYSKFKCNIDLDLITIALRNLASNACQFTKEGNILTGFVTDEHECIFYVKDTGIGISKENQEKIFNHFIKGNSFYKGSGLGINICLNITKILGGKFGLYSTKKEGSLFWMSFPVKGTHKLEPGMEAMAKDRLNNIKKQIAEGLWFSKDGQGKYISSKKNSSERKPIQTKDRKLYTYIKRKTTRNLSHIAVIAFVLLAIPSIAWGEIINKIGYTTMFNSLINIKEEFIVRDNIHWISSVVLTLLLILLISLVLDFSHLLLSNLQFEQSTNILQSILDSFPHRIQIFDKDKNNKFTTLIFDNLNNNVENDYNSIEEPDIICNEKRYIVHHGKEEKLLILHEDITEIMEAKNRAEKSKQFKTAFLSNMSHDIRTPLSIIVGFSSLLAETQNKQELEEYIGFINQNTQYLLSLLTDIVRISELQTTTLETEKTRVKFEKMSQLLVKTSKQLIENSGKAQGLTLISNNPFETLEFVVDSPKLTRILTNLLTNAIKYTFSGTIETYTFLRDGILYFTVKDTGIGIKKDKIEEVFISYKQLSTVAPGTGLGMALSTAMAKTINGKIGVYSVEGKGSLFWFCFKPEIKKIKYRVYTDKETEILREKKELLYSLIKQSYSPF